MLTSDDVLTSDDTDDVLTTCHVPTSDDTLTSDDVLTSCHVLKSDDTRVTHTTGVDDRPDGVVTSDDGRGTDP